MAKKVLCNRDCVYMDMPATVRPSIKLYHVTGSDDEVACQQSLN